MGANNTIKISKTTLDGCKIATILKNNSRSDIVDLYYLPGKYLFTIPCKWDFRSKEDGTVEVKYNEIYHYSQFMQISKWVSEGDNHRIDFKYFDKDLHTKSFHFLSVGEYLKVYELVSKLNAKQRNGQDRKIAVIANPMSGKKRAVSYYNDILKPLLETEGIKSDLYVFEQKQGLIDWIENLNPDSINFNELVLISGDGSFYLVYNSFANHKHKDELMKIPIGFIPGGSGNATAWALGSINPYVAAGNILKGNITKADILEVTLDSQKKVYGGTLNYGISVDVTNNDDKRQLFGALRYHASVFYRLYLCSHLPIYPIEMHYRLSQTKSGAEEWK